MAGAIWFLAAAVLCHAALAQAGAQCSVENKSQCGGSFCNFALFARTACDFTWTSAAGSGMVAFMCITSNVTGTCESCPQGWTASGAFCVECDPLSSCDRDGAVACRGACAVGDFPVCQPFVNRVSCSPCALNATVLSEERRTVTRGGVLGAPDLCGAYFKCEVGYYLQQDASRQLKCQPCVVPEASQSGWAFASRGLTFGDAFSCVYGPLAVPTSANSYGQYGALVQSCPVGFTSEPGRGLTAADCVACPSPPLNGGFATEVPECVPECNAGFARVGESCIPVDARVVDCDGDGYVLADAGASCRAQPFPWNPRGTTSAGGLVVASAARGQEWAALDEARDFRVVIGANRLARSGVADFCSNLIPTIPNTAYVQDRPLSTFICSETEKHEFYLLANGAKYLYVFLERSFGNNNRFVMWQVQKQKQGDGNNAGQVWQRWRLPAKVCSAVVAPGDVVYLAFCGATFVAFVPADDYMGATGVQYDVYSKGVGYWVGRRVRILVGQDASGQRDGMRDQALFAGPLSIAATSDPKRLLLADEGNCRIVEVVVDYPGSFLTRATTVGQGYCFSGAFPTPYPRLITSVLDGAAALFVTDLGLMQLDARTRGFSVVMSGSELERAIGEPRWMFVDASGEVLTLLNATHTATVTRRSEPCAGRTVSKRGGACQLCATGTFASDNSCVACSTPSCGENHTLVECSDTRDARCVRCEGTAAFPFRFGPDCGIVPQFPCPAGFYGAADCFPCAAKMVEALPGYGVCQCLGFPLGAGMSCEVPSPFPSAVGPHASVPPWVRNMGCTYLDANCSERGCYLSRVHPRECLVCPEGYVGLNGLWCEACPGFRSAGAAQDYCVCRPPSYLSSDGGSCVCPVGHAAGGPLGCQPCGAGRVQGSLTELLEDFQATAGPACSACPDGSEANGEATACVPCAAGLYREGGMTACGRCPGEASFARSPWSSASCTACAKSCALGKRWAPCPVNASWLACEDCSLISRFKSWVSRGENRDCLWECAAGFYEYEGECWPCTRKTCGPGFQFTACSRYEDSHCRVPCDRPDMPEENAVWAADCSWECAEGYTRVLKEYPGWNEYACVVEPDMPWSLRY